MIGSKLNECSNINNSSVMTSSSVYTSINSVQNLVINNASSQCQCNEAEDNKRLELLTSIEIDPEINEKPWQKSKIDIQHKINSNNNISNVPGNQISTRRSPTTTINQTNSNSNPNVIVNTCTTGKFLSRKTTEGTYESNSLRTLKTPLLDTFTPNSKALSPTKNSTTSSVYNFNPLIQSNSELNQLPDLNNKEFVRNFLYFINMTPFPIKFVDSGKYFFYTIPQCEKEYNFLNTFLHNFNIYSFTLDKWYCYDYYSLVFQNFSSYEFISDNTLLFFYSYYTEIVDNFLRNLNEDANQSENYLMIEENPVKLINLSKANEKKNETIVLYVMVQNNSSGIDK